MLSNRRRVVFQVGLGGCFEHAGVAADGHHFLDLKRRRLAHDGAEDDAAAGRVADEIRFTDTQGFKKSLQMFDAHSCWV